jgi:hypothetical protein
MQTTHVYLFGNLLPLFAGGTGVAALHPDDEAHLLDRAMTLDLAERLVENEGLCVTLFCDREPGGDVVTGERLAFVLQRRLPIGERVQEAVRSFYERNESGNLIVMLGRNPLHGPAEIGRAAVMLDQEDDTVVYAASAAAEHGAVVLVATRRYHPGLFRFPDPGIPELNLRNVVGVDALVLPLRPLRTISGEADLPWFMHEVEREVLLGHRHPTRTYTMLRALRRRRIIPEQT